MSVSDDELWFLGYLMEHCGSFDEAGGVNVGRNWTGPEGAPNEHAKALATRLKRDGESLGEFITNLKTQGLVESARTSTSHRVWPSGPGIDLVRRYEASQREPKDYWREIGAWFRSKRWSVAVLIVVVGLPVIVKWIEMLKDVLRWVGAGRSVD